MQIQRLEEFLISSTIHQQIAQLLVDCFSEYPHQRSYLKQQPSFRYLVWEANQLIAHLGVEHRKIRVADSVCSIFGVADLCVHQAHQSQKIASTLLSQLEQLGQDNGIDFIVLTSGEHQFYQKNGFNLVQNTCRWLMINEHQTLGVAHRRIEESLMVKTLGDKPWKSGLVDFLGHIF